MPEPSKKLILSNNIYIRRAERRFSQQALAEAIGVTRATINAIEKGNYNPSLELAFRLAQYFETDIHSIFFIEEDQNEKI